MKVTIVVPCHNGAAFISDALESIQRQTHAHLECIVVDDASSDNSREVISGHVRHDSRVKGIFLEKNVGVAAARNYALEHADGDWVTLLDADDLYKPDRLEQLLALAVQTKADMIVDNQDVTDFPDTRLRFHAFRFLTGKTAPVPINQELFLRELTRFPSPFSLTAGYMKPMFLRAFLEQHHLRFDTRFSSGEDTVLFAESLTWGPRFFGTSYSGYVHRRRRNSLSRSGVYLRDHAAITDALIARHGERLSAESKSILRYRKRLFSRWAALQDVRVAWNQRCYSRALGLALSHPSILLMVREFLQRELIRRSGGPAEG